MIVTFDDVLDHLLAYAGTDASQSATTAHRRSVQNAYQVIPTRHNWTCYYGVARVVTNGSFVDGTIQYTFTGGAFERMCELTTTDAGVWPTWAGLGYIVLDNVPYTVEARKSDTIITLLAATCPQADIAAGEPFTLLQDRYQLPPDFISGDEVIVNEIGTVMSYMHPRDWAGQRRVNVGPGQPWAFTYIGNPNVPGSIVMALFPPPDQTYQIDALYKRKMRPLNFSGVDAGLVSVTGSAVTGVGTAFTAAMVGSIIRFGTDNQTDPTGQTGNNPCAFEATIATFASGTSITIDTPATTALTSVKYLVSDPIDLDVTVMNEYFLRECEKQWRAISRSKATPEEMQMYTMALTQAREADNRDNSRAAVMRKQSRRSGFIHYPINFFG